MVFSMDSGRALIITRGQWRTRLVRTRRACVYLTISFSPPTKTSDEAVLLHHVRGRCGSVRQSKPPLGSPFLHICPRIGPESRLPSVCSCYIPSDVLPYRD